MNASRRRTPLHCAQAEAAFADGLEGNLRGEVRLVFDAHLVECPACAAAFAGYAAAVGLARAACRAEEAEPVPEDLVASILAARSARRPED